MAGPKYSEEECILTLELYTTIERKDIRVDNPKIIRLSKFLTENGFPRSAGSIKAKLENFKACDPMYPGTSISHNARMDQEVWNRFYNTGFADLFDAAEKCREQISANGGSASASSYLYGSEGGTTTVREVKQRVNQDIFRARVLETYDHKCCITGMQYSPVLQACHIKPWPKSPEGSPERLDPRNGLCMNKVHHAAFDAGLFTVDEHFRIELSPCLPDNETKEILEQFYYPYEGLEIKPAIALYKPSQEYLDYHRKNIFLEG